ncbi:MAG: nucleotidyltransferase domain-containing protein [Nanoarchaeota archaeon]
MVKKLTKYNIIELYLNNYGKSIYLRELASLIGKPHQTVKPYVEELVKEKILLKNARKNIVEYSLNFKESKVYDYIIISEKEKLIERLNKDILLKTLLEKLSMSFEKNTFVIFGSAVSQINKGSDIDLLIIGDDNIIKIIKEFEDIYDKKIHKVQVKNLNGLTLTFAKEIYKKHLILNNTEAVIRFFGGLHGQNKLV